MTSLASTPPLLLGSLTVAMLWGVVPIIHKWLLKDSSAKGTQNDGSIDWKLIMVIGGFSYFVCLFAFTLWHQKDLRKNLASLTPRAILWIMIGSVVGGFLANLIYFLVLKRHDSFIVSALIYCSPVFTLILAYLLLQEQVRAFGVIGVLLITAGIVCISFN